MAYTQQYTDQRIAYGETLVELGRENKNIVVLDADLGGSTMGKLFEQAFPERHFEVGIAEANMTSMAAGLALTDKIPFVNSFAVFSTGRAYDQIRQSIAIGELNVKIVGSSAGLSDFGDGATHQSVEDIAIMRAIPNLTVICPADANETVQATRAIAAYDGPVYMRINRGDIPNVTDPNKPFIIDEPYVMREGKDLVIFATGITVAMALEAAEKSKYSIKVVNVSTLKPFDGYNIETIAQGIRPLLCTEEHSLIGGLNSAIQDVFRLDLDKRIYDQSISDQFGRSARNYQELLDYYYISADSILSYTDNIIENDLLERKANG